ncbi:MAG: OsmC family protein [Elusimicrobia bacterium]|nr:OsmC family protein [Elusimicrobiota bacterium]
MEIKIKFPGNRRVSAEVRGFTVSTDQPREAGGDASAPGPFDLFLASIGTCAGIFALGFCQKRGIATEGLELVETADWDEAGHRVCKVSLEILLPPGFPEKYREGIVNAVNLCTVKKHILEPPIFQTRANRRPPA